MDIKVLTPRSEEEWDKYILRSKYASFLQSFCWAQLFAISNGFRPVFLEVQDKGNPVAYLLFHETFLYTRSNNMRHRVINFIEKPFAKYIKAIGGPVILDIDRAEEILSRKASAD